MRILFIIATSNFGGTENFLLNLIKGLASAGVTVGIVCPGNGIFKEELGNVFYIDTKKDGLFSSLGSILKIVAEFKPDIIHTHLSRASYIGLYIRAICKIPVVANVHNLLGRSQEGYRQSSFGLPKYTDMVFKLLTIFGGKLIAVSDSVKEALTADRIDTAKIKVIWNGTSFADLPVPERNNNLRNKHNIKDDQIVVGITCNVKKGKGQLLAVEAVALMPKEIRDKIKLVMIGRDFNDKYKESIDQFVEEHSLQDSVIFAGVYTNMREIYADIDIFLHPSFFETCSMAVIEAMSTAKPVVVSNISANSAIVDDNINGCLVELDPPAIEAALSKLISDPDMCAFLSANARSKAESDFSLKKMTSNYIDFYNSVLTRQP